MARDTLPEVVTQPGENSPEQVRARWIAELRRQGHRQCTGDLFGDGARVCAMGLLAEMVGVLPEEQDAIWVFDIGAHAGLSKAQSEEVWRRNDGASIKGLDTSPPSVCNRFYLPHTFAEIADVVEGWFR